MTAKFGPAGNSDSFRAMGYRKTEQVPEYIRRMGLDAYEYQCGKGVTVGEATARAIGQAAAQAGIALSLHAPYFVNPANPEPDSQAKTAGYVLAACRVARWMGADRVVVHTGAIQKPARRPWPPRGSASERCGTGVTRRGIRISSCARRPWERSISWGTWKRF